ncbi:DUF5327 family protein [Alteribacillus sp. YIM 98480]|uniref:DUF5327 family protein n=1 Tax=Alteribacillus sp. YIM 98480 TaxID=2606599 RepID=UPI00131E3709|nr:DUF5327 family protein [Alteribacillus sp. YIM 98480]
MNISARTVVEKMEEELMQLAEKVDRKEEAVVKEHARVLKAYCDIILASDESKRNRNTDTVETAKISSKTAGIKQSSIETKQVNSSSAARTTSEIPSSDGNLLEF